MRKVFCKRKGTKITKKSYETYLRIRKSKKRQIYLGIKKERRKGNVGEG